MWPQRTGRLYTDGMLCRLVHPFLNTYIAVSLSKHSRNTNQLNIGPFKLKFRLCWKNVRLIYDRSCFWWEKICCKNVQDCFFLSIRNREYLYSKINKCTLSVLSSNSMKRLRQWKWLILSNLLLRIPTIYMFIQFRLHCKIY